MPVVKGYRYLLGDSSFEVRRLAFQARVWEAMTEALLDRHRVGPGWKVLDVGAGTGTVTFPLARRVAGSGGEVHALERSPRYADYLRRKAARLGLQHLKVVEGEILTAPLPPEEYDLVFARWVFLFLPRVEEHLRRLAGALKPGGLLAIEDYHRDAFALYPGFPSWRHFIPADKAWFASQGGDLNIGGRLPALFCRAGLELREVHPNIQVGRPGSDVWRWAEAYILGYLGEIGAFRPFTPARAAAFRREWAVHRRTPGAVLVSPVILDVVGRKPGRRGRGPGR